MLVVRHIKENSYLYRLFKIIIIVINFGVILFGCRSYFKSKVIYKIYAGFWIILLTMVLFYAVLYVHRYKFSMAGLIVLVYHITQMLAHLVILLESLKMDSKRRRFELNFAEFEKRFINELGTPVTDDDDYRQYMCQGWIHVILGFALSLFTAVHIIMTFAKYPLDLSDVLHWYFLPSTLAIQFRILELLVDITALNEYATVLRCRINEIGERNLSKVFGLPSAYKGEVVKGYIIWVKPHKLSEATSAGQHKQSAANVEQRKLYACKIFYGEIYKMFKITNDHYGWSLFAFILKYYLNFVLYSYWIVLLLVVHVAKPLYLLMNLGFLVISVKYLWILCWESQTSQEQSRQIRSIMFKIVKPAGRRSYNSLVKHFSLQTLHQQYTITAKDFFNLNLSLLGSMAASIVTYLVILIQFMLAGKNEAGGTTEEPAIGPRFAKK